MTAIPTNIPITTVRGRIVRGPCGNPTPAASKAVRSNQVMPTPAAIPMADARNPTTMASITIITVTCDAVAPTARSIAISLVRWAMMIENVL